MLIILYIFAKTIQIILGLVTFCMFIRVILPIFVEPENSRVYFFVCMVTEPFVIPVRAIMAKFNIGQNSIIDWAFFVSYALLGFIKMLLPSI